MKISVRQEVLADGLQTVQRTSVSRSPMQVLTGILFEAKDGVLSLAATDLETSIRLSLPATVSQDGAVVLPARVIVELAKRAPSEDIVIEAAENQTNAKVHFGRSSFTINGFAREQFPSIPEEISDGGQLLEGSLLHDAIAATAFSVSSNDMRPVLTGIHLRWAEKKMHAVATDGFRVAHFNAVAGESVTDAIEVVVPSRAAQELARLGDQGEEPLKVTLAENHLLAQTRNVLFQSSLLTGQFPAVLDMMPKEYPTTVTADMSALSEALERVALIAASPDHSNALRIRLADGQAAITAESADVGAGEEIVAVAIDGEGMEIAFNSRYLLDGLRHISGDSVTLALSGATSAARITGSDERLAYWVLPLRIS